jgi:hypothetical protein
MISNAFLRFSNTSLYDFDLNDFELNLAISSLKNLNESKSSFTLPISIPITPASTSIFKNIININNTSTITRQRIDCQLIQNNKCLINGYAYVNEVNDDSYKVIIASADLDIFSDIKDDYLRDLDFSNYMNDTGTQSKHDWIYSNQNLNPNSYIRAITFLNFDWFNEGRTITSGIAGTNYNYNKLINDYRLTPVLRVKDIFDKILIDKGYTYTASTSFTDKLSKMVMTTNVPESDYTVSGLTRYYFFAGGDNKLVYQTWPDIKYCYNQYRNGYTMINNVIDTTHSNYSSYFNPKLEQNSNYTLTISFWACLSGDTTQSTAKFCLNRINLMENVDGKKIEFSEVQITTTTLTKYTTTINYQTGSSDNIGDYYKMSVDKGDNVVIFSKNGSDYSDIQIINPTHLFNSELNIITYNSLLPIDYKQFDFMNNLLSMFNMYIYADPMDKKHLHFETFDDFYTDDILDWSKKMTLENLENEDLAKQMNKEYSISFEDPSDLISQEYNNTHDPKLNTKDLSNPNKNSDNSSNEIKLKAESGVFTDRFYDVHYNSPNKSNKAMMTHYSSQNSKVIFGFLNKFNVNSSVLLFYDGDYYTGTDFVNYPIESYLTMSPFLLNAEFATFIDMRISNTFNLQFVSENQYLTHTNLPSVTNNNLYTEYWINDIDCKLNGNYKFLRCRMNLNETDISVLNLKKKIYIDNSLLGSAYYRINNIKYSNNPENLSIVELIKLTNYLPTAASTVNVNNCTFSGVNATGGGGTSSGSAGSGGGSVNLTNYYTKGELNNGQLNNLYYTESQVDSGLTSKLDSSVYNIGFNSLSTAISTGILVDASLITAISSEISVRSSGDASLTTVLSTNIDQPVKTTSTPSFSGLTLTHNATTTSDISKNVFTSGFAGTGWKIDSSTNTIESDNFIVRGTLSAYQLLIQQIRSVNGGLFISAGNQKFEVDNGSTDDYYRIGIDTDGGNRATSLEVGDIIKAQSVTAAGVKSTLLKVDFLGAGGAYVGCLKTSLTGSTPTIGDEFVVYDSETVARRGVLYLTANDSGNPYLDVAVGDGTGTLTTKLRAGRLDAINDSSVGLTGQTNNFGLYTDNFFGKGTVIATSGLVGNWTINSSGISTSNIQISSTNNLIKVSKDASNYMQMHYTSASSYGIIGVSAGNTLLQLGSSNTIAGWTITTDSIYSTDVAGKPIYIKRSTSSSGNYGRGFSIKTNTTTYKDTEGIQIGQLSPRVSNGLYQDTIYSAGATDYGIAVYGYSATYRPILFRVDGQGGVMASFKFDAVNGFFDDNGNQIRSYAGDIQLNGDILATVTGFTVQGNQSNAAVLTFKNTSTESSSAGEYRRVIDIYNNAGYGSYTDYIRFYVGTTAGGYISDSNGTLTFVQESDRKLKKDIVTSKLDALTAINALELVEFTWKDDNKAIYTGRQKGFIAQDFKKYIPEAVSSRNNTLGIGLEVMHTYYIKSIQQLNQKIYEQNVVIEQLKKQLNDK